MDEFALIRHYFRGLTPAREDVGLGIGDDCALLRPPPGEELAVTTDTLVAGRHFPDCATPYDIGWKALAVNLSDLAAMAAAPRWFLLALTLPAAEEGWLAAFAQGLGDLARSHGVALVGGDTTRGPLSVTITALGSAPAGAAVRRAGARVGDLLCVTGTLGDAALALRCLQAGAACAESLQLRLHRPQPRIEAGRALRGLASAAIDLSDGLAGDLPHILDASGVGADIDVDALPASVDFAVAAGERRRALQLAGGDDYELCVCLPPQHLDEARQRLDLPLTPIGRITERPRLRFVDAGGAELPLNLSAYRHFG
jgi:thiamine-monophosphate kinase